jgi:hypothetical protein
MKRLLIIAFVLFSVVQSHAQTVYGIVNSMEFYKEDMAGQYHLSEEFDNMVNTYFSASPGEFELRVANETFTYKVTSTMRRDLQQGVYSYWWKVDVYRNHKYMGYGADLMMFHPDGSKTFSITIMDNSGKLRAELTSY